MQQQIDFGPDRGSSQGPCSHPKCPKTQIKPPNLTDIDLGSGSGGASFCSEPECPKKKKGV